MYDFIWDFQEEPEEGKVFILLMKISDDVYVDLGNIQSVENGWYVHPKGWKEYGFTVSSVKKAQILLMTKVLESFTQAISSEMTDLIYE